MVDHAELQTRAFSTFAFWVGNSRPQNFEVRGFLRLGFFSTRATKKADKRFHLCFEPATSGEREARLTASTCAADSNIGKVTGDDIWTEPFGVKRQMRPMSVGVSPDLGRRGFERSVTRGFRGT